MAVSEHQLMTLRQQLVLHRTALRELWVQKATHEQAITGIKITLLANGLSVDSSPYDGPGHATPQPSIPDEAQRFVERALGGPAAMANWEREK
jgi:hypothetical protein